MLSLPHFFLNFADLAAPVEGERLPVLALCSLLGNSDVKQTLKRTFCAGTEWVRFRFSRVPFPCLYFTQPDGDLFTIQNFGELIPGLTLLLFFVICNFQFSGKG